MRPRTALRGLAATALCAMPLCAATVSTVSAHERHDDPEELYDHPVAFQLRLGYETTSVQLDRVRFSGRAEPFDAVSYDRQGIPDTVQLHGIALQPNLVYQPSAAPLQLLVGLRVGFGLGAPPSYTTQTADVVAVPDPEQLVVGLRAGAPLGIRFPFGPVGLHAEMIPGVAMITIDERVQSFSSVVGGSATGASAAGAMMLRGQGGFDFRLGDLVGLYVDGGYDLGPMRGWSLGAGIAILDEPSP